MVSVEYGQEKEAQCVTVVALDDCQFFLFVSQNEKEKDSEAMRERERRKTKKGKERKWKTFD